MEGVGRVNPRGPPGLSLRGEWRLDGWLGPLVILIVWVALQTWVLPRFGVPT
jgi:hypothetical protein